MVVAGTADDGAGAIKLFPKHDPGEVARENAFRKTKAEVRLLSHAFMEPIRTADHEGDLLDEGGINFFLEESREGGGAELFTALIERDDKMLGILSLAIRKPAEFGENLLAGPLFRSMGLEYGLLDLPNAFQTLKKHLTQLVIS